MNSQVLQQIKEANILQTNCIGIEREGLRVKQSGCIATSSHPKSFGSPLTNTIITTDFAESLIEIVTPPLNSAQQTLDFLENSLHFVYHNLKNNENIWPSSMPCVIRGQTEINIAKYGTSNQALMKEVYRLGLQNRYGSAMQVVAGVHFNYSFSDNFWQNYQKILNDTQTLRNFKDDRYMHLIRNILRYGWILYYYFGASNSVCKSFLHNYNHNLINFNNTTLYMPNATSLRMGDIGYQNTREDEAGVKANYNSVLQYSHSLQDSMRTPFNDYQSFETKKNGKYQQLNANILQIENEYYSSVRPKPKLQDGIMPSISLINNGIEYIELRNIDINPLNHLGIDKAQILLLESFLLFCLLTDSKPISSAEQVVIDENNHKVTHQGLNQNLYLMQDKNQILLQQWLQEITTQIEKCSILFSQEHNKALKNIIQQTPPSTLLLKEMRSKNQGFSKFTNHLAKQYQSYFLHKKIDKTHFQMLEQEAKKSLASTQNLENSNISFDKFLSDYFNQL